jgi:hypothetical protein
MKTSNELQHEIECLEGMIRVLHRCMVVFKTEKKIESLKNNIMDLHKCKVEMKRLVEERENALIREKEKIGDAIL